MENGQRSGGNSRLDALDWLRGLASLWVMLYHISVTVEKPKYFGLPEISAFTSAGYRGVDLFFLLSGFVMAHVYHRETGNASFGAVADFAVRRAFRIFPAFMVVSVALIISGVVVGIGLPDGAVVDARFVVTNLLLVPRDDLTTFVPVVAWTLTHELMFYTVFLIAFFSQRWFIAALVVWASVALGTAELDISVPGMHMVLSPLNALFLVGVACQHVASRIRLDRTGTFATVLAAGACLAVGVALEDRWFVDYPPFLSVVQPWYVLGFAGIVVAAAVGTWPVGMPGAGVLAFLGQISYGLYLVHYPIVVAVAIAWKSVGAYRTMVSPFVVVTVVASAIAMIAAAILHTVVEVPGIASGKRLAQRITM
jgi:exopolysaccharide production protein ExoZ